jgi:hypothetical protein
VNVTLFSWGGENYEQSLVVNAALVGLPMKRDGRSDSRTAAAFKDDGKFPTEQVKSFAHANQTESMPSVLDIRSETDSVVRDLEVNFVKTSNNLDVGIFRATMFGDVVQCFLDDSKRQSATSSDQSFDIGGWQRMRTTFPFTLLSASFSANENLRVIGFSSKEVL